MALRDHDAMHLIDERDAIVSVCRPSTDEIHPISSFDRCLFSYHNLLLNHADQNSVDPIFDARCLERMVAGRTPHHSYE